MRERERERERKNSIQDVEEIHESSILYSIKLQATLHHIICKRIHVTLQIYLTHNIIKYCRKFSCSFHMLKLCLVFHLCCITN